MTTTVTINHDGPDHHDVLITRTMYDKVSYHRLRPGDHLTEAIWDNKTLQISEVPRMTDTQETHEQNSDV